jgi:hypothetical protein
MALHFGRCTNKTPSFELSGGGEGRGTNLDEVAWLIASLKATITQQNDTIQNVRTDLAEIKSEQQNLKSQNAQLQDHNRVYQVFYETLGDMAMGVGPFLRRHRGALK